MPITATRRLEWDALHRVPRHEGRCRAYHGHRYTAEITCAADALDDRGRVVDFGVIKGEVGQFIDQRWDHTALLMRDDPDPAIPVIAKANEALGRPVYWLDGPPTAENIAAELGRISAKLLEKHRVRVVHVRVYETPNCWADWAASDAD
ncbi:6-carboxytetrahydropterin synthase [Myxococcota bacterium]|nr:6-carboxytetrahydropterin synthase [Myxococcota bacterium]MBU1431292.1 6-carboxytetrahydropterin synthase [Myxococcota bacterium]MBU1896939.1 6-carboxytetrahydropterin synthase [Myxococcota bacterium]